MTKVIDQFNWSPGAPVELSHKSASVTVPDMAYSVEELIERHRNGLLTDVERDPVWPSEEPDFDDPDMEKMMREDIDVKHDFAKAGREAVEAARAVRSDQEAKEAALARQKEIDDAVAAKVAELTKPPA